MFNNQKVGPTFWQVVASGLLLVPGVWADPGQVRQAIQDALVQRHPNDTPEWWRGLGPETPAVAIQMFGETKNPLYRIHLIQGLSAFSDNAQAVDFIKGQTQSESSVIRVAAAGSLGASQGERALDDLSALLKHEDAQTRFAAAEAIRRVPGDRSGAILKEYFKNEKVTWIVQRVQKPPKEPGALKTVPAPEVIAVANDFVGEWKGYWIAPLKPGSTELGSTPCKLKVTGDATELRAQFVLGKSGNRSYTASSGTVQSGILRAKFFRPEQPKSGLPLQAEFAASSATATLLVHVPSLTATAVLSRAVTNQKPQ